MKPEESAFLVLQNHSVSGYTNKERSPPWLQFTTHMVQVHPGVPLEHKIYYITWPETCLRHRFLVCWLAPFFFFWNSSFMLLTQVVGLQRQVKVSRKRKSSLPRRDRPGCRDLKKLQKVASIPVIAASFLLRIKLHYCSVLHLLCILTVFCSFLKHLQ